MDFIVLGLPRSGTTWLANWLTTDKTLCLHEPFAFGMPETWPKDHRKFGMSCAFSFMLDGWLERFDCPIALIDRPREDRLKSVQAMGYEMPDGAEEKFAETVGRHFPFDVLWDEEKAKELWSFLLSDIPFDAIRYRELSRMQVQPHMASWSFNPSVFDELHRLGYLRRR